MSEAPDVELQRIMERIRERIKQRSGADGIAAPMSDPPSSPFADPQTAADFAYLHTGHDIQQGPIASHRAVLGRAVMAAKRTLRRLLGSIFERQVAYNAANTRVITQLKGWVERLHARVERLDRQLAEPYPGFVEQLAALQQAQEQLARDNARLRAELDDVASRLERDVVPRFEREVEGLESRLEREIAQVRAAHAALEAELRASQALAEQAIGAEAARLGALGDDLARQGGTLEALRAASDAARERISRAERKLRRILYASDPGELVDRSGAAPASASAGPDGPPADMFDYAGLEERFRGSEAEIKDRQLVYRPYFEGRDNVLDIGCGRGEFLEVMRESGVKARGVDLDLDMVLLCREKGLDVQQGDLFAYLEALPDDSLGGIFAGQVIEHLPPPRVVQLVRLCHRKLEPGGVLVMETPNPKCLLIFAETFYKDPSHHQPLHPDTMAFVLESLGFKQVEVRFLSPVDPSFRVPALPGEGSEVERFNRAIDRVNALLFGFQDYAVIGRKSLAASPLPSGGAAIAP